VETYYPALKAHLAAQGRALPGYVEREFEGYLKCGRLEHQAPTRTERRASMTWAQRLKRVFNIDIETCQECGGAVRIIAWSQVNLQGEYDFTRSAANEDPFDMQRILALKIG
jgi:rRNA maturation protein Nop10